MTEAVGRDRAATQQAILQATLESMADGGEANVRVADVARRAGVTTGAIYSNFESREGLVAAAHILHVQREVQTIIDSVANWPMTAYSIQDLDELRAQGHLFLGKDARSRRRGWAEAGLMAHRNEDLATTLVPLGRSAIDLIADQIRRTQAAGARRGDLDPQAMAVLLTGASLGVAILAGLYTNDDPDFEDKLAAAWPYIETAFASPEALAAAQQDLETGE